MLTTDYSNLRGFSGFAVKSGIAIPDDLATLGEFQGLQRAINAGRAAKGLPRIDDDGEIGPATLAAAKSLLPEAGAAFPFLTSVNTLATNAKAAANIIAASFGTAPSFEPTPAAPRPRVTAPAAIVPTSNGGSGKLLFLGGAAILGVGAVFYFTRRRKGRKAS